VAVPRDANWSDVVVYSTHSQNCSDNFFIKMSEALGLRKLSFMTVFLAPKIMLFKLMFIGPCVILIFEQR